MSDFRPPTTTYRALAARAWARWESICAQPQLWGIYTVGSVFMVLHPNVHALFLGELARPIGMVGAIVSTLMVHHNWRRPHTDRAQLTIPDIVFFGAAFVIIAGLAEPIYDLLNQQAAELGTGAGYLLQMVVPGLLITLVIILFAIASGGGQ